VSAQLRTNTGALQAQREDAMTTTIYIRAREPDNGRRLIDELLQQGLSADRLHVYGKHLPQGLPVEATRWRNTASSILPGALLGAVAVPAIWLVLFKMPSTLYVLLLGLLGAAVGGWWSLYRERREDSPLNAQRQAMQHGELMIAADVDDDEVKEMEQRISQRHPEMMMLGPDAKGSPPFP
jgi:hypothetical protein